MNVDGKTRYWYDQVAILAGAKDVEIQTEPPTGLTVPRGDGPVEVSSMGEERGRIKVR